jgi:hypothetical protein
VPSESTSEKTDTDARNGLPPTFEYARGDVHVNTAESSHALIRRGLIGIYHNVHRYLWQFDFLWNNRQLNDGERTIVR